MTTNDQTDPRGYRERVKNDRGVITLELTPGEAAHVHASLTAMRDHYDRHGIRHNLPTFNAFLRTRIAEALSEIAGW